MRANEGLWRPAMDNIAFTNDLLPASPDLSGLRHIATHETHGRLLHVRTS